MGIPNCSCVKIWLVCAMSFIKIFETLRRKKKNIQILLKTIPSGKRSFRAVKILHPGMLVCFNPILLSTLGMPRLYFFEHVSTLGPRDFTLQHSLIHLGMLPSYLHISWFTLGKTFTAAVLCILSKFWLLVQMEGTGIRDNSENWITRQSWTSCHAEL